MPPEFPNQFRDVPAAEHPPPTTASAARPQLGANGEMGDVVGRYRGGGDEGRYGGAGRYSGGPSRRAGRWRSAPVG